MKINADEMYAGVPILGIRKLLKEALTSLGWDARFVEAELEVGAKTAARVVQDLARDGYIEPVPKARRTWRNTQKGNALANASAAALLHRNTAERKLSEFLDRVRYVNSSECPFLHFVERVVLFGSMLTDKQRVSDIDLSFRLERKPVSDYVEAGRQRVEAARARGRRFETYFRELEWPELEVLLYLRQRSRSLSFIRWNDDWMATQPHRIIYERSSSTSIHKARRPPGRRKKDGARNET